MTPPKTLMEAAHDLAEAWSVLFWTVLETLRIPDLAEWITRKAER